ncbi:MAG: DUF1232 domain-containing protein [Xanthomonadales bacterium]|nr:DUF1232 domain-containing protein [Xanthomonadales bacterium]
MRITFELDSGDLERFQHAFERARRLAANADEIDIVDAAKQALDALSMDGVPSYVRRRLVHVQRLLLMFEDDEWALPDPERADALAVLAYFSDPDDLIPDHIAGIGLIDDAVMLELLARRMRHVLDAWERFRVFRDGLASESDEAAARLERSRRLAAERSAIFGALRARRRRCAAIAVAK